MIFYDFYLDTYLFLCKNVCATLLLFLIIFDSSGRTTGCIFYLRHVCLMSIQNIVRTRNIIVCCDGKCNFKFASRTSCIFFILLDGPLYSTSGWKYNDLPFLKPLYSNQQCHLGKKFQQLVHEAFCILIFPWLVCYIHL